MTTAREDAENELRTKADFKPKLVLEGGAIHTYSPVKGKRNKDGDETEDPMIGITFRVPVDTAVRYMGIITRLWRSETNVSLGLMFTEPAEQMKTGLADAAGKNGSGADRATGLEPIPIGRGPGSKKRETAKA